MLREKMFDKDTDVFLPVPERRQPEANAVDSEIQLFTKSSRFDFFFQIPRSRRDDARAVGMVLVRLTIRQDREQYSLALQIQFVNSVQKKGSQSLCAPVVNFSQLRFKQ